MTIVSQDIDEIEVHTKEAIFEIRSWQQEAGLTLADHKIEVVLITKRRKLSDLESCQLHLASCSSSLGTVFEVGL